MASRLLSVAAHLKKSPSVLKHTRSLITGPQWLSKCKKVQVLDSYINYYDSEKNPHEAVIFLHGNPTSSYLWRNIIPHVTHKARCLAPDLIGMGGSGKSGNGSYRFVDHYKYLSEWFNIVSLDLPERVVIVCHDWGSALGFHWCRLNLARVRGLVHMESIAAPIESWEDWPEVARSFFQALRSDAGEEMVIKKNLFVKRLLPLSIMRELKPEEMEAYTAPYMVEGEDRRPTLTWPREIPVKTDGPEDVVKIVDDFQKFLKSTPGLPKLFIEADPGFFTQGIRKEALKWPDTSTVRVKGLHFLQEDSPDEIGMAIKLFVNKLDKQS